MKVKKRWSRYAGAAAIVIAVGAGVLTYSGGGAHNPVPVTGNGSVADAAAPVTTLSLDADTDFGALPPWSVWSGSVGTLGAGDHCWQFDGAGNITDDCGSWDLTKNGSPRTQVETGLPVLSGGTVSWTGEQAAWFPGTVGNNYTKTSVTQTATNKVSVTVVFNEQPDTDNSSNYVSVLTAGYANGFSVNLGNAATIQGYTSADGDLAIGTAKKYNDGAWHCATWVIDCSGPNKATAYIDGAASGVTDTCTDSWAATAVNAYAPLQIAGNAVKGGMARARIDYGAAATLADHQALCGSLYQPARRDHAAYADMSYTRTGGVSCWPTSATTAVCWPDALPYYWDGTDRRMVIDDGGRINRLKYSAEPNCTRWTCATATAAASVAPDGSKTAQSYTMGGGTVTSPKATGYTNSATLYPVLWVKCSSGTLSIVAADGAGDWDIACATIGGAWTLIKTAAHAAVTENTAWTAAGDGDLKIQLSGADAEIWMPSWTEEDNTPIGVVVPTITAAVDTGTGAWTITNAGDTYWKAGDVVTPDLTEISGTCFVTGNPLRLSGASGSECVGGWNTLEITR